MGIFGGTTSPCDSEVEKATDERNSKEDWSLIIEICDKAGKSTQDSKDYLKAIIKRMNHQDPHVSVQAVTLLDACVKNCGKTFHIEVASRDFESEYTKLIKRSSPVLVTKLKESLKRWAENEFKQDPQLNLIPSLYHNLKRGGMDFSTHEQPKRTVVLSKDPNVVQSQEEEDQIAKAIELSLKEASGSPRNTAESTSLYPSTNLSQAAALPVKEERKVRALYDFEAAEDNELTFSAGEIIFVIDDADPNWWKGKNQRGEGLFPANFVTTDLTLDTDQLLHEKKKKLVELDESFDKKLEEIKEPENIEIDEVKIDRLLHLLHEADPTNPEQDTKEMLMLEKEVNSMGGLIDKELERVDRKHAQLTQLSSDLVEAFNLYHTLMREPQYSTMPMNKMPYYQGGPPNMVFNGTLSHQMGPQGPGPMMSYNTLPHDRSFLPSGPPNMHYGLPPGHHPPPGHMPPGPIPQGPMPNQMPGQMQGQMPPPNQILSIGPPLQISAPPQSLPSMGPQDSRLPPQSYQPQQQGFTPGGPPGGPVPPHNGYSMPPANTHIM